MFHKVRTIGIAGSNNRRKFWSQAMYFADNVSSTHLLSSIKQLEYEETNNWFWLKTIASRHAKRRTMLLRTAKMFFTKIARKEIKEQAKELKGGE